MQRYAHVEEKNGCRKPTQKSRLKRFQCPQCDYKVAYKYNLKPHIKAIHSKIIDQECDQCDFKTALPEHLTRHMRQVHRKIKTNRCTQCDFVAAEASSILSHVKAVHTGTKDKECQHCDYRCSASGPLARHVRVVHKMEKRYQCPRCEYKASQAYNLKRHIKTIHEGNADFVTKGRGPGDNMATDSVLAMDKPRRNLNRSNAFERSHLREKGKTATCECEMCKEHLSIIVALTVILARLQ